MRQASAVDTAGVYALREGAGLYAVGWRAVAAGLVYVALGSSFLAEAELAAASARAQMPQLETCLITEADVEPPGFGRVIVVEPLERDEFRALLGGADAPDAHRAFFEKIRFLERTPYERTLFLDTDTRVVEPIWELLAALHSADIVAAHAPHRRFFRTPRPTAPWFQPELNTGVLAFRSGLEEFFTRWRDLFVRYYKGPEAVYSDQSVFAQAVASTDVRVCTVPHEFNCRVSVPTHLVGPVKVLHGRSHEKLERAAGFLNQTEVPRLYVPGTGLLWAGEHGYRFLAIDGDEPAALSRRDLIVRLTGVGADGEAVREASGASAGNTHVLRIKTTLAPATLRARLKEWEPWAHRIDFSNGVSTAEFERRVPFVENTLQKLSIAARAVPFERVETALDVGCNAGYNGLHLAREHDIHVTGIDVVPRHVEVARFLAGLAGVEAEFLLASADEFLRPRTYDLVLHFGTLYHLMNPARALEVTFSNLRPGGWLALETQVYDEPGRPKLSYFLHGENNDPTNFWALSTATLLELLELSGFAGVEELIRVEPATGGDNMARILLVARRPPVPSEEEPAEGSFARTAQPV
jgi:SAM-dependent methyltransferase